MKGVIEVKIMKKILVTGAQGFIGSNVTKELLRRGYGVIAVDDLSAGLSNLHGINNANLEFYKEDIRNTEKMARYLQDADGVIHEACRVVAASTQDLTTDLDVNARGTLQLLQLARDAGVNAFVYASSASVYGDTGDEAAHEEMKPNPSSPYAISKLAGEHYALHLDDTESMRTVALRYFNVIGEGQNEHGVYGGVVPIFFDRLAKGENLRIYGDGSHTRDYTHVNDVARITVDTLFNERAYGQVFNVGRGEETSVAQLAETMLNLHGVQGTDRKIDYAAPRAHDNISRRRCDMDKAQNVLGAACQISLEEGLKMMHDARYGTLSEAELDEGFTEREVSRGGEIGY